MSESFTICTECKHVFIKDGCTIWHHCYCTAVRLGVERDPFDGKIKPCQSNDSGTKVFVDEIHPHCRTINPEGLCMYFEKSCSDSMINRPEARDAR